MLIRRVGNKSKLAKEIQFYFPEHNTYFEPFFGAGGMFFNKPLAQYNYLNDSDSNIHNLFMCLQYKTKELYDFIDLVPYSKDTWNWLKSLEPKNDIEKAVKFIILSNYGYLGCAKTIVFKIDNSKEILLRNFNLTVEYLLKNSSNIQFNNTDFRDFLKQFSIKHKTELNKVFVYCDPPYLDSDKTQNKRYNMDTWLLQDFQDLVKSLLDFGAEFAISEFDNPKIKEVALENNLTIIPICERRNLKNKATEILIINYDTPPKLF